MRHFDHLSGRDLLNLQKFRTIGEETAYFAKQTSCFDIAEGQFLRNEANWKVNVPVRLLGDFAYLSANCVTTVSFHSTGIPSVAVPKAITIRPNLRRPFDFWSIHIVGLRLQREAMQIPSRNASAIGYGRAQDT
jgi:hypothetical protein